MSFATYAGFRTALTNWLDIDDAVSAEIDDVITVAESRINKEVRHRLMEKALTGTISSGVVAIPSDFVELRYAYISGSPTVTLQPKAAEWIFQTYPTRSAMGKPKYIGLDIGNFVFGPYPDSGYTIGGSYYYRFAALSSALNALFTAHPDLYLFAALAESEPYFGRDQRIPTWESRYQNIKNALNKENTQGRFSGGPLQVTPSF